MSTKDFLMKSFLLICVFIVTSGLFLASCSTDNDNNGGSNRYTASLDFSHSIAINNQTVFNIHASNGTIEIDGLAATDTVRIWGERRVESSSSADAEARLANLTVSVEEDTNKIVVKTEQPENTEGRSYIVDYHVLLPENWQITASQANGDVSVASIHGAVGIWLSNGTVTLDSVHDNVDVVLANGSINGRVYLPLAGRCDMSVANGSIDLEIPQSTSAEFSASVANGSVSVNNLNLQNMVSTQTSVTGTLGSGDGFIDLGAANGQIIVTGF